MQGQASAKPCIPWIITYSFSLLTSTTKLLGVIINSNLTWDDNCQQIIKKSSPKLWILRKLKNLKLDTNYLINFFIKEVRCHLEFQAPLWAVALTTRQSQDLQRVERAGLTIITSSSPRTTSYSGVCEFLGIDKLSTRRKALALGFATNTATKFRHQELFGPNLTNHNTRHHTKYRQYNCRTARFKKSPLIHLTQLLNEHS